MSVGLQAEARVAQQTKLWYLKNVNLFHGMSDDQMRMVEERTVMREIRRKEVLYLPGDAGDRIYLLKRGVVKISTLTEDGREIILALLRPGEVFGEEAVLEDAPRDHMAEAHDDALLCVITRSDFMAVMRAHPEMAFKVTKLVGFRLKTLRNRVEGLLFKGAPARLAQTVLDLARDHGVKDAKGILVPLKLSQQDLANLIGVTRESVNLALADFRSRGLVELEGRSLRVLQPDQLKALT
ncbi:MAG TPA: Crp/Fnr family transcriptional regulator [Vicinamibacteria bacterium]|nr:Crp/Fnr family transcriptional regulator [Vicinamibacteria bacterium]